MAASKAERLRFLPGNKKWNAAARRLTATSCQFVPCRAFVPIGLPFLLTDCRAPAPPVSQRGCLFHGRDSLRLLRGGEA